MKTLMLLLLCSPALADTLTYQSQTLAGTSTEVNGPATIVLSINDVYTVDVTISGPLAPNLNMTTITPTAWTVLCQSCQAPLSSSPVTAMMTATSAVFMFSTDQTGKVTNWSFSINGNFYLPFDDGSTNGSIINQGSGVYTSGASDVGNSTDLGSGKPYTVLTSGPRGIWTQSSLSNPAPAVQVLARTCNGTWGPPSNSVPGGLTPNADGSAMNCRVPAQYPSSWYMKTTIDGGKTVQFVQLKTLGLGNGK